MSISISAPLTLPKFSPSRLPRLRAGKGNPSMMRRVLLGLGLAVVILLGGALAYAPYLPSLALEGFPALTWSGRGAYAEIAGARTPGDLHVSASAATTPLVPELATPFTEKGGKALLVYRDGALALEHYEAGADQTTRFNSFSMAKSLVGALIYRALAEGKLQSLDQTLGELLPDDHGIAHVIAAPAARHARRHPFRRGEQARHRLGQG